MGITMKNKRTGNYTAPDKTDLNRWYVYTHTDPETGEIVYVGEGTGQRFAAVNTRATDHSTFLKEVIHNKNLNCFNIVESRLTKEQARGIEKQLIAKYNPKFNKLK
jgi:hypothetical protein